MGQKRHVDVYLLVTVDTFEERLLDTLASKSDLAVAALDLASDVSELQLRTGMEDMKRRLEKLLGEPPAPQDQRAQQRRVQEEADEVAARQQRIATAGASVLSAVCQLVDELLPRTEQKAPDPAVVSHVRGGLESLVGKDESGQRQLQLPLADAESLDRLAGTLAQLIGASRG